MKAEKINEILRDVEEILHQVLLKRRRYQEVIQSISLAHQKSAINLLDYLSLRSHDLRKLQRKLGYLGMSRLARAEAHVEASLKTTICYLKKILSLPATLPTKYNLSIKQSEKLLNKNSRKLLGEGHDLRRLRIMVTLPSVAAHQPAMVEQMIQSGMDVARINCAHDTEEAWLRMIRNVRNASKILNRSVKVSMDIGGPKIRTGSFNPINVPEGSKIRLVGCPLNLQDGITEIPCTLPEIIPHLRSGETVYFDDGEIATRVISNRQNDALLEVIRVKNGKASLKPDKGINLPQSKLKLHGLTQVDKDNLPFIAQHADIINFSFVNTPDDVAELQEELRKLGAFHKLGIIYKIETQQAYNNLPQILLQAMKGNDFGIMIARGDLAIEVGWENIGQVQREMLAICNASHTPVVWATQVLENLAKKGLPSRSEITDTVNATKADCIMLNKGAHILEAIRLLGSIIASMEGYQEKNAPLLPKLKKFRI